MQKTQNSEHLFVVGIASSAGGLQPMMELIANAICHENMAFVLVPHILREYKTMLPEILKKVTNLKILEIQNDMILQPCHLYILPAGFYARMVEKKFILDKRPKGINQAANVLFKSLAAAHGKNSIGVVLSGSAVGSDGSEGVIAIKKADGHTYAQTPGSCEYPDMPKAAIETGHVDLIMDADQIGHDLSLVSWATE